MSEEENSNEEKEENEEKEGNDEEKEENDEENEENNEEKENKEENENEEKKDGEKEEENEEDNNDKKKDSNKNKFGESKLKPSSEIKIDLKSNENNNFNINKLNISNHSILTAAFANNSPPIPFISSHNIAIQLKSNLKIINDINRDMDLLSNKINRHIVPQNFSNNAFPTFQNNLVENNYSYYDKEDYEIKKLINKANALTNTNYTTYTTYKNNLNNYNNLNKKYSNNYFQTFNNKSESSIDSKDNDMNYNNNYVQTMPIFRNNYIIGNNKKYFLKTHNKVPNEGNYNHKIKNKMINHYTNTSPEESLYSNYKENEKGYHHSRNLHKRKYFNNGNNFIRSVNNNLNRAATYNGKHKLRYYLNENDKNNNNKNQLYLRTYNQSRKKPLIYIQPETFNSNSKRKKYHSNNKYILNRDNYQKNKKRFYRFNTENDNRAINILMGYD